MELSKCRSKPVPSGCLSFEGALAAQRCKLRGSLVQARTRLRPEARLWTFVQLTMGSCQTHEDEYADIGSHRFEAAALRPRPPQRCLATWYGSLRTGNRPQRLRLPPALATLARMLGCHPRSRVAKRGRPRLFSRKPPPLPALRQARSQRFRYSSCQLSSLSGQERPGDIAMSDARVPARPPGLKEEIGLHFDHISDLQVAAPAMAPAREPCSSPVLGDPASASAGELGARQRPLSATRELRHGLGTPTAVTAASPLVTTPTSGETAASRWPPAGTPPLHRPGQSEDLLSTVQSRRPTCSWKTSISVVAFKGCLSGPLACHGL